MSVSGKVASSQSSSQTLQYSFNDDLKTLSVEGFVTSKVGHKITLTVGTTTVANDTETLRYYDGSTLLCTIVSVYTDGTRTLLSSVERTA